MADLTKMSVEELVKQLLTEHKYGLTYSYDAILAELTRRVEVHPNVTSAIGTLQRLHAKGTNQSRAYMIQEVERALADLGAAEQALAAKGVEGKTDEPTKKPEIQMNNTPEHLKQLVSIDTSPYEKERDDAQSRGLCGHVGCDSSMTFTTICQQPKNHVGKHGGMGAEWNTSAGLFERLDRAAKGVEG